MGTPVTSIKNIGPAFEAALSRAGIHSAEELRSTGADLAYERMLKAGERPHFIGYYVLVMALQGRPWNDCKGKEKETLRKRFDEIKARVKPTQNSEIERILNQIGVVARNR